jgi:hypothetical protein
MVFFIHFAKIGEKLADFRLQVAVFISLNQKQLAKLKLFFLILKLELCHLKPDPSDSERAKQTCNLKSAT